MIRAIAATRETLVCMWYFGSYLIRMSTLLIVLGAGTTLELIGNPANFFRELEAEQAFWKPRRLPQP